MTILDRSVKAAALAGTLVLVIGSGVAPAHSGGGTTSSMSHSSMSHSIGSAPGLHFSQQRNTSPGMSSPSLTTRTSPLSAATKRADELAAGSQTTIVPPPDFASVCQGETSANCEATLQSRFDASNGDPSPIWQTPVPTLVPPTPPAPQIVEPSSDTALPLEQSGGSSPPLTAGGGPTLADCMDLWDPSVHMSKALWKTTCVRTMNGINMPDDGLGLDKSTQSRQAKAARHEIQN